MAIEHIRAEICRLERELVQAELDERGSFEFLWNGTIVIAEPVERPHGRMSIEDYWRAKVGTKSLEFRATRQREGVDTAWDVYASACDAQRNTYGSCPQEAADRMYTELNGFRYEVNGFLGMAD